MILSTPLKWLVFRSGQILEPQCGRIRTWRSQLSWSLGLNPSRRRLASLFLAAALAMKGRATRGRWMKVCLSMGDNIPSIRLLECNLTLFFVQFRVFIFSRWILWPSMWVGTEIKKIPEYMSDTVLYKLFIVTVFASCTAAPILLHMVQCSCKHRYCDY